jgi:hypothetical protein
MDSSITFHPNKARRNEDLILTMTACVEWAAELADASGMKTCMTMQHDLRNDGFTLMVAWGTRTFSARSTNPKTAYGDVSRQLYKQVERFYAEEQEKESASRKASRKGSGRKSTAGLRRS